MLNDIKKEKKGFDYQIILLMIFLICLNFLGLPNQFAAVLWLFFVFYAIYRNVTLNFSYEFLLLVITFILYFSILMFHGAPLTLFNIMVFFVMPIMMYFIGNVLVNSEHDFKTLVYCIGLGFSVHAFLNFLSLKQGELWYEYILIDFWNKQELSATLQGPMFSIMNALLFYFILFEKSKIVKLVGIIVVVVGITNSIMTANRTLLFETVLIFGLCLIFYIIFSKCSKIKIKHCLLVVFLIAVFVALYRLNFLNLKINFEKSSLYLRIFDVNSKEEVFETARSQTFIEACQQLFLFPFGGHQMILTNNTWVHNLWLDTANATGYITFIFLALFSLSSIINFIRVILNKKNDISMKIFVFALLLCMLINLSLEPVLEGEPYYFAMWCCISGAIYKLNRSNHTK